MDLVLYSLLDPYKPFVTKFHMRNLNVIFMDLFKMLGDVEGGIIEKEPLSHSNAIEYGNEFEQKVLSLLKEKKIIVIEMLNQGIKRNAYFKIAPNHDSNETN